MGGARPAVGLFVPDWHVSGQAGQSQVDQTGSVTSPVLSFSVLQHRWSPFFFKIDFSPSSESLPVRIPVTQSFLVTAAASPRLQIRMSGRLWLCFSVIFPSGFPGLFPIL